MNPKITEHHRSRPAYIYLRQSTPSQVRHHQESTERQYALREKALELGWSESADPHAGSGPGQDGDRDGEAGGLQDLGGGCLDGPSGRGVCVGSLAAGALESRLASAAGVVRAHRNAGDRRRWLLRSGGFQRRTVARIEGRPWPRPNYIFCTRASRAVSSTKRRKASCVSRFRSVFATTSKAVSSWTRMQKCGARWAWCFVSFAKRAAPLRSMQRFAESGLRFPKRSYGGAWDGKIIWGRLTHSRVLGMLKNPSYAGMYVFGRYQYRREISPDGEVHKRMQAVAMADWRVSLKEHHEGYITLEEFFKNQERLEKNRTNGEETVLSRPSARRAGFTTRAAVVRQLWPRPYGALHAATAAFIPAINATGYVATAWRPRTA